MVLKRSHELLYYKLLGCDLKKLITIDYVGIHTDRYATANSVHFSQIPHTDILKKEKKGEFARKEGTFKFSHHFYIVA